MLSTELSEAEVSALKANRDRLAKDLHHSCQWGYGIRWGEYVIVFILESSWISIRSPSLFRSVIYMSAN